MNRFSVSPSFMTSSGVLREADDELGVDAARAFNFFFFFSLQRHGRLEGAFEMLWRRFWDRYLEQSGDDELLEVTAPFFAFRGLVMASPVWYRNLPENVRRKLFTFVENVLAEERFDPERANAYAEA